MAITRICLKPTLKTILIQNQSTNKSRKIEDIKNINKSETEKPGEKTFSEIKG